MTEPSITERFSALAQRIEAKLPARHVPLFGLLVGSLPTFAKMASAHMLAELATLSGGRPLGGEYAAAASDYPRSAVRVAATVAHLSSALDEETAAQLEELVALLPDLACDSVAVTLRSYPGGGALVDRYEEANP